MTAVQARLSLIRREMLGLSPAHDAALRLLQAKLAKNGKKVRPPHQRHRHACYVTDAGRHLHVFRYITKGTVVKGGKALESRGSPSPETDELTCPAT